jgi:hypothetical protein
MGEKRHVSGEAQEVAEIFETLATRIPEMINGILGSLFSPESAKNMGKAVGEFRASLIEAGIPEEEAMQMTREYLGTLTNFSGMIKEASRSRKYREE